MRQIELHDTGRALVGAVAAAPLDDAPRLVVADWLDETGREAEALWARLIRVQIAISRYKRENEAHLPADPRLATPADLVRVRPRDMGRELGLDLREKDDCDPPWLGDWEPGWLADLVPRLPGLPPGWVAGETVDLDGFSPFKGCPVPGPSEAYGPTFTRFAGIDLTKDLVRIGLTGATQFGFIVDLWRGFPVQAWNRYVLAEELGVLGDLYRAVSTFAVRADLPADESDAAHAAAGRPPGLAHGCHSDGARPVVAGEHPVMHQGRTVMGAYWAPGTSLAPAAPASLWIGPEAEVAAAAYYCV